MAMTIDGSNGLTFPNSSTQTVAAPGTLATLQNTTSGTAINFTGIPSSAKRITMMFNGVSTNGSSIPIVRIGSGSIDTTGYLSTGVQLVDAATVNALTDTTGFQIRYANASLFINGSIILTTMGGNIWVVQGCMSNSVAGTGYAYMTSGAKTLSGALDRVQLTTVGGTDTFDAGSMNILYEY
jgi:hypothetical protein